VTRSRRVSGATRRRAEAVAAVDADGRYPDVLARAFSSAPAVERHQCRHQRNKVLRDGADGGNFDTYGPRH